MKKVLEGELTSLAHSILKAKSDDVHMLKEKAGLLYEKLCILSFAEKHFAGKQPSIGKMEFKSAFEYDLDDVITPKSQLNFKETNVVAPPSSAENTPTPTKDEASKETPLTPNKSEDYEVEPTPITSASNTTDHKDVEEVSKKADADENAVSEENIIKHHHTNEERKSSEKENDNALFQPLAEEDFGVHLDDLPDFEPVTSTPKKAEEVDSTAPNSAKNQATSPINEEKKAEIKPEAEKPQRTMDLFSQDKKSLNDQLKTDLKIGLNDRLAFTKKLFDGNVNAYNQTLAKVANFERYEEVEMYLYNEVRPNFSWDHHEAVEQRFLELISTKFN